MFSGEDGNIQRRKVFSGINFILGLFSILSGASLVLGQKFLNLDLDFFIIIAYEQVAFGSICMVLHFLHSNNYINTSKGVSLFLLTWLGLSIFLASQIGGITGPLGYIFIPLPMVPLIFFSVRKSIAWFFFILFVCIVTSVVIDDFTTSAYLTANVAMYFASMLATFSIATIFKFVIEKSSELRSRVVEDTISVLNSYSRQNFDRTLIVDSPDNTYQKLATGINKLGQDLNMSLREVQNYQMNLEDIIKKRTDELQNTQSKLMNASRLAALGEMAGGIAHEINNPLATILLRATHIRRMLEKQDTEIDSRIFDFLKIIEETVNRTEKIVNGLRTFSRSGDNEEFVFEKLSTIIKETLSLCEERFLNHNIKLEVDNVSSTLEIECRPVQISQVLLNLLNNARFAVRDFEGERRVTLKIEDLGDKVIMSVIDTGPGIPKEIQDKILFPFFTTKQIGEGTGLGLSISKAIAESHKGSLYLDTESPHTRFVVEVPKVQPTEKAA